jgi:hypothetical protein
MDDKFNPYKMDEAGGIYFTRQLEYVKARAIEEKLAPLSYQQHLPISAEMPLGAEVLTWRSYKSYGLARMISDYGKDFPRVELGATENSIKVKDLGVSYGWTINEIRRAQFAGMDLETRKATAARRAVEQKMNSLAWNGDTAYGIQGFIKYPGTTEYVVPATGTGSSKTWAAKTADQILTDLNGIKNAVYLTTNGMEMIDTILIPMAQLDLIKNLRMNTYNDTTVYEFFIRNNPGITINAVRELDGAGTGGIDVMVAYKKDPEHLEFHVPMQFEQFEPQQSGMEFVVPCHARCAGTIFYLPLSCAWGEGI